MIPGVDTAELIRAVGYAGIFVIIFAETGLLVGFFLPGDSLLFTAGFLASQQVISVWILIPVAFVAAVTGDATGYAFGRRVGRALFRRRESFFFRRSALERTEAFFERHGGKVIVIARVMPIARTFAPIVAGIGTMSYPRFAAYNLVGGAVWTAGVSLAGYYLGKTIPGVDRYLLPIVGVIIVLSVAPGAIAFWREGGPQHLIAALRGRRTRPAKHGAAEDDR